MLPGVSMRPISKGKETLLIFYLSKNRKSNLTKRFFKKALASCHTSKPRVLTVDKNPVYSKAVKQSQKSENLPSGIQLRQIKYLSNMVEQYHRFIKKRVRICSGFNLSKLRQ